MTRLSADEYQVLSRYVRGEHPDDIQVALALRASDVQRIIREVGGGNRDRARQVLDVSAAGGAQAPVAVVNVPAAPRPLEQLLTAGEGHEQPRIRAMAKRARAQLDALQDVLYEDERAREAKEKIARLEAELASARAQLRPAHKPKAKAVDPGGAKAVRAWAREHNVPCPDRGVLPKAVVDAYEQRGSKR